MHKLLQFMLLKVRPYEILKVIQLSQVHERLKQTNITCMQYRVILSKKNAITIFIRYFENDTILGITIYHQTICSSLVWICRRSGARQSLTNSPLPPIRDVLVLHPPVHMKQLWFQLKMCNMCTWHDLSVPLCQHHNK